MRRWALIQDGKVANVVEQNECPQISGEWVECSGQPIGPGFGWTGETFTSPAAASQRHLSVGSFFDRFGDAKWAILADTSPAVQAVVRDASVRRYIDLDNPQLPAGLAVLVAAGHQINVELILGAPVLEGEAP